MNWLRAWKIGSSILFAVEHLIVEGVATIPFTLKGARYSITVRRES